LILLTIAIPTHNRLKYLKELLPGLLKQCEPYPEIEVLISDNCTTDGTHQYIKGMATINPHMRYRRNSTNVGGEENVVQCVESAQGEYVWIFGDDELLCEGGIGTVINTLKTHPVSLLILCGGQKKDILWFGTYADFIKNNTPQTIINQAFLTCNIFKKAIFNTTVARSRNTTKFGHFILSYAIIDALMDRGIVSRINTPIYHVRSKRAPPSTKMKYIRLKYIQLLLYLKVSHPRILYFICFDLIWASILRQIHKLKRII